MIIPEKIIYQAHAKAIGGRDGHVSTLDGQFSMALARPKEMSGSGEGCNPEQLFAAGYSACFLGAMRFVAHNYQVVLPETLSVEAIVGFGPIPEGFGLHVELRIAAPGIDHDTLTSIVEHAHRVCPYSNATRNNIEVKLVI
ncbi:organic hydroperoxide resistance protein [bacterium]|jgi:Ohr subfamily peroxiredoxin|nr:organic hydroperoxide resistance protein [bacterium]NBW56180.1 organic hydroperoxide resistance protein [bacterium]NBX72253.1 organic hydroperoxide resistance protein [bacterium]